MSPVKKPKPTVGASRRALTSSASCNWGTPAIVRAFSATVLRPASLLGSAIDVDASTSAYWQAQWNDADRPVRYFDGSAPVLDILELAAWQALPTEIGTVHENPPGDPSGKLVQMCWDMLEIRWQSGEIDSLCWVGFSLEQMRSLQNTPRGQAHGTAINPLSRDIGVGSIVPGRRISYMVHPRDAVHALTQRMRKLTRGAARDALAAKVRAIQALKSDAPIPGDAPTHSSYLTVLWSHDDEKRAQQQEAARVFLASQRDVKGSPFQTYALIGAWED